MSGRNRKGMALITVVLIAALVFASIAGIVASVVPENKMVASRSASQRALTAAETGLSQVLFNLRNADFSKNENDPEATAPGTGTVAYLTISDVALIATTPAGSGDVVLKSNGYGERPVSDTSDPPYVTYNVKIKKMSGSASFDPLSLPANPGAISLTIYSLGTVYTDSHKTTVLARKAIAATLGVTFGFVAGASIKYGILSGNSINFDSNSVLVSDADVRAGGDITKGPHSDNSYIVIGGIAYATGHIDSTIVDPSKEREAAPSPTHTLEQLFDSLDGTYPEATAYAFNIGSAPYDGTKVGNPNTNTDVQMVKDILAYYLDNSDFAKFLGFYSFLKSPFVDPRDKQETSLSVQVIIFFQELYLVKDKIFCYYKGDAKVTGSTNFPDVCGAIYVDGGLSIGSALTIGDDTMPFDRRLTLRVTGNVDLGGGCTINGNIFASGETATVKPNTPAIGVGNCTLNGYFVTPLDMAVSGGLNVVGSLITRKSIEVKGTVNVTYVNRGLEAISIPNSEVAATTLPGTWKEVSFDTFAKTP